MAIDAPPPREADKPRTPRRQTQPVTPWSVVLGAFKALASLRLTVALLGIAIFLVFAGTLAQTRYDMWTVVDKYFRAWFVWVEFRVFFPESFFPTISQWDWSLPVFGKQFDGVPFPGGKALGVVMAVNLLAAHTLRFKMQARGLRLLAGLGVFALGCLVTGLVIARGETAEGIQGHIVDYGTLWVVLRYSVLVFCLGTIAATVYVFTSFASQRHIERWTLFVAAVVLTLLAGYLFLVDSSARLGDPSLRILWQLITATFAGLVLLGGCFLIFKKRAGIVLIHLGIGFLMFNELWVGAMHVESQMTLEEVKGGEPERAKINWVKDIRKLELAVIQRGAGQEGRDRVVAIPESRLLAKNADGYVRIKDKQLPFDVQVEKFYRNSNVLNVGPGEDNPATDGQGKYWKVQEAPLVTAVDSDKENQPAAYVRFIDKESSETISTNLLSVMQTYLARWTPTELDRLEEITAGGKTYDVYLRTKRIYKPYHVTLIDVSRKDYTGTNNPRDYSSDIHIRYDNGKPGKDRVTFARNVHIWMNNPLRAAGDTFYQSMWHPADPLFFGERSTLQVMNNGGWMIPYVCCMIVAVGLLFQFGTTLSRFLNRQADDAPRADRLAGGEPVLAALAELPKPPPRRETAPEPKRSKKDSRRKQSRPGQPLPPLAANTTPPWIKALGRWLPLIVVGLCTVLVLWTSRPSSSRRGEMNIYEFGKLPISEDGRLKPLDTLARNSLKIISSRDYVKDGNDKRQPAIRWLLDVMSDAEGAGDYHIFRITSHELLRVLNLKPRPRLRYSFNEIQPSFPILRREVAAAREQSAESAASLSATQRKILELNKHVQWYLAIQAGNRLPPDTSDIGRMVPHLTGTAHVIQGDELGNVPALIPVASKKDHWEAFTTAGARAALQQLARERNIKTADDLTKSLMKDVKGLGLVEHLLQSRDLQEDVVKKVVEMLGEQDNTQYDGPGALKRLKEMGEAETNRLMERAKALVAAQVETNLQASLARSIPIVLGKEKLTDEPNAAALAMTTTLNAYADRDAEQFDSALADYTRALATGPAEGYNATRTRFEAFFNNSAPFVFAWVLCIVSFVLVALSWIGWFQPLNRTAFGLLALTLVIHTFGLVSRVYISGRPPVTNLYSSAIFIGWGLVVMGLVVEMIFKMSFGNLVAAVSGFGALQIAHQLGLRGDTIQELQPVLDTQFWLSTHVVCVTLGYAATFKAGVLACVYVLCGVLSPALTANVSRILGRVIYGIVCFALFFSFIGTVLGGLWADDSWGRFWGWDPKENGALMIVIWNAIVLHARWAGMVKERGLAVLAIGGNIVTSWSWFGVNELGVGLHSYGFTEGVLLFLGGFIASQLVLIFVGCLPKDWWWSFNQPDGK